MKKTAVIFLLLFLCFACNDNKQANAPQNNQPAEDNQTQQPAEEQTVSKPVD